MGKGRKGRKVPAQTRVPDGIVVLADSWTHKTEQIARRSAVSR